MDRYVKLRKTSMVVAITIALALVVLMLLFFRPSDETIRTDGSSWLMPGGGPAHLSYLPFAPRQGLVERWGTRLEGELAGPPAVAGDRVYLSCENGLLYCLDIESGRPVWRFDAGSGIESMPSVSEEGVFVSTHTGKVCCVGPGGDLTWAYEVGGAIHSTPIPEGGRVYFGSSDNHVYCVKAGDGSLLWSFEAEGAMEVPLCLFEGCVFGVSWEGDLFALDAADGRLLWTYRTGGVPVAAPVADDGKVFLATELELHCTDAQSGRLLWKYGIGPTVISNLALRGNQLLAVQGGMGSQAVSLDSRTGDLLWQADCGDTASWTALVATNEDIYLCGIGQLRVLAAESGIRRMDYDIDGLLPGTLGLTADLVLAGTEARKVYCLGE